MASYPDKTNLPTAKTGAQFYSLERLEPSPRYLELARAAPCWLDRPKNLLIISDLNGTLLVRDRDLNTSKNRPHVIRFLEYCFEHHYVAVWSSARRRNVHAMLAELFIPRQMSRLVAIWSREDSRLGEFINERVQVYKQLRWFWDDPTVQASACRPRDLDIPGTKRSDPEPGEWDQSNVVLVDDSLEKADSEP